MQCAPDIKYGDDVYYGNTGNQYPVNSGSIEIIALKDFKESNIYLGNTGKFNNSFDCLKDDVTLTFGNIEIMTELDDKYDFHFNVFDENY